jgi:hypothetical protein
MEVYRGGSLSDARSRASTIGFEAIVWRESSNSSSSTAIGEISENIQRSPLSSYGCIGGWIDF